MNKICRITRIIRQAIGSRAAAHIHLMIATILFTGNTSDAQTYFKWPDSKFDVTRYRHFESCRAVQTRVLDSARSRTVYVTDTIHHSKITGFIPQIPIVVQTTKECLRAFNTNDVAPDSYYFAQSLYLDAGEVEAAKAFVSRKLSSISTADIDAIAAAMDTAINVYVLSTPIRLSEAFEVFEEMEKLGTSVSVTTRLSALKKLQEAALQAKDTARQYSVNNKVIAIGKLLSDEQWNFTPGAYVSIMMYLAFPEMYRTRFNAALAKSTDEYRKTMDELFQETFGRETALPGFNPVGIAGTPAKPIVGDYWFPEKLSDAVFPNPGKVTLVVTLLSEQEWAGAFSGAAVLRRIQARFPELEIVLLAKTTGYFKETYPPPPELEAMYIDSMYRQFHNYPGQLVVTNTQFWRLPGYDRRRIDDPTENEINGYANKQLQGKLIDKEGKIVANFFCNTSYLGERLLENLIPVLLNRPIGSK